LTIESSTYKAITSFKNTQSSEILEKALSGDIIIKCFPETITRAATAEAFSRDVEVRLETSGGEVHGWYNGTLPVAATDASSAGTASIADSATEVTLVNGIGTIAVEGDTAAWLGGVAQVETATVVGTIATAGNATVTVTSAGMAGSPKAITVAVAVDDNASAIATKIRAALTADTAVSGKFTVGGTEATVVLTAKTKTANDTTLNIAIADDTGEGACVGITAAATSANTTAGVAPETNTLTVSKNTSVPILTSVAAATSVETIV